MAAINYYISSINTKQELTAFACANYASFESGQCSSCGSDGKLCRKLGYQTPLSPAYRAFYMTTLNGVSPPNFGEEQATLI